jgi:hypothetical protein
MIRHLTEDQVNNQFDLPLVQPSTELRRGDSIIVATVKTSLGQRLRYRWCQMQLINVITAGVPVKKISSLGLVYCGLYAAGINSILEPAGIPVNYLSLDSVGTTCSNPFIYFDFPCPDTYSVILANNTTNLDFEVELNGLMRLFLDE